MKLAAGEFGRKKTGDEKEVIRTQRDISMKIIVAGIAITLVAVFLFFAFGVVDNIWHAVIGLLTVGVIAFLFTTVAANAIAIVGTNPVSGMTLMTLILASIIMVACGLNGTAGMTAALIIGGVVCTALFGGRSLRDRPEDRILDRKHSEKAGDMEIPRDSRCSRHSGRRDADSQPDIRIHR